MNPPKHTSLLRRLLKMAALLLVLLTAAGAVTACVMREKIVAKIFDIAETRLAEEGLYLTRASQDWSMTRGVILNQVELFSDKERRKTLARFDNIAIRIPLMELFHKAASLHLSAINSGLTLDTNAGPLRVDQVNFSMTFTRGSLTIAHLDSRLRSLNVTATGLIHWPQGRKEGSFKFPDLAPLVKASTWLDFPQGTPTLALEVGDSPAGGIDLTGNLTGNHFKWRNLTVTRADMTATLADDTVVIPSLDLDCYGGNLKAALTVDHANGLLKVHKLASTVEPFRFVEAMMDRTTLTSYRTLGTTTLTGKGLVFDTRDFYRSTGVLKVSSPAGLAIGIGSKHVVMREFRGSLELTDGTLVVDDARFAAFGGTGAGTYSVPILGTYTYQLRVKGEGLSVEDIGREFGLDGPLAGRINLTFDGGGASELITHYGKGTIEVMDGDFYSIPIFGSLRSMLTRQSATFGVDEARNLNCNYKLWNGVVHSQDLRIESTATKLLASGKVDLIHKMLNADVRANLRGIPGIATGVLSHMFELHGEGPLNDVHWKLANAPGIVSGAAEVTVGGVNAVTEGAGKVIEGVGGTASKIVEGRPGILIPMPRAKTDK